MYQWYCERKTVLTIERTGAKFNTSVILLEKYGIIKVGKKTGQGFYKKEGPGKYWRWT